MKKRLTALLLCAALTATLLAAPAAAFADVTDSRTATAVETLRLMGVLDGYGDGTFRPNASLTRAQFCKMAVYATDGSGELGRYSAVTIFPDVKPSHWAASYINMAAKKGVIAGFADGRFRPDSTVTAGQAVTILLRALGYKDADIGGVWPQSYMAMAESIDLLDGTGIVSGSAPLTRGQAAKLFLRLLSTAQKGGGTLYTLGSTVSLTSVDGGKGTLTAGGKTYDMVRPVAATVLTGLQGQVVTNAAGKALTFLPASESATGGVANAAVIVSADKSAVGLEAVAGTTSYSIYKNGVAATVSDLRKNDVAAYNAATNSVVVCDTRVTVYYEDCAPSAAAPTTVTALGREFNVLPTAMDSVAKFKPGQLMTLLLTADGQIAGAASPDAGLRSNAMGVVSADGEVRLLCGATLLTLGTSADSEYAGQVVRISSNRRNEISLSIAAGNVTGNLDASARKVGSVALADNALFFDCGEETGLSTLEGTEISVSFVRTNWAGKADLIAINGGSQSDKTIYGRVIVRDSDSDQTIEIVYGDGKTTGAIKNAVSVSTGDYAAVRVSDGRFTSFALLTELKGVTASAWVGKTAVNVGGKTYAVSANVPCYNRDTGSWMKLENALAYAGTMRLFVSGTMVRVIEVKA